MSSSSPNRLPTFTITAGRAILQDYTATAGSSEDVVRGLLQCLADSYAFGALAQNAHWNLDNTLAFSELHEFFGDLYGSSFSRVDDFAERIRQLGSYAPADLGVFKTMANLGATLIPPLSPNDWVMALIDGLGKVRVNLLVLQEASGAAKDLQTQDMTIKALQDVDKSLWMLRSSVEDGTAE